MKARPSTAWFAVVASFLAIACGGSIAREGDAEDAGAWSGDAVAPSTPEAGPRDVGAADVGLPDAGCGGLSAILMQFPGAPWAGGELFDRLEDFVAFFEHLAEANELVIPSHDVDCAGGVDAAGCTYDPRTRQTDSADVHYSDALQEFIGPDGDHWVWLYVQDRNEWFAASEEQSPESYALLASMNACGVP
jgi:hypothetical protein